MSAIVIDDSIKTHSVSSMMNAKDNDGNTPMHCAVFNCKESGDRHIATLVTLLKLGANPYMENHNKKTPRQEAELRGCKDTIEILELFEEAYYKAYFSGILLSSDNDAAKKAARATLAEQGVSIADGGKTIVLDGDHMSEDPEDMEKVKQSLGALYKE